MTCKAFIRLRWKGQQKRTTIRCGIDKPHLKHEGTAEGVRMRWYEVPGDVDTVPSWLELLESGAP